MVLVGRVGRTHGIRGQVAVTPDTDFVAERFRRGAQGVNQGLIRQRIRE